jgi:hypothetical protein
MVSFDDCELNALMDAARSLPVEGRSAFLVDVAQAIALTGPHGSIRMIEKLQRLHLWRCMARMSPGDHRGDSEIGTHASQKNGRALEIPDCGSSGHNHRLRRSPARASDRDPVHPQRRLADADRHALAVLAASADTVVEREVAADHGDAVEVGRAVADQHRALDRRADLAVLDPIGLGAN